MGVEDDVEGVGDAEEGERAHDFGVNGTPVLVDGGGNVELVEDFLGDGPGEADEVDFGFGDPDDVPGGEFDQDVVGEAGDGFQKAPDGVEEVGNEFHQSRAPMMMPSARSEEHTSELQSRED